MTQPILKISNLTVKTATKTILKNISFNLQPGSFQVILGPNGSGKSTLASFLAGQPDYQADEKSQIGFNGENLLAMTADERARAGLFLAFQQPVAIPGLKVLNFLWLAYQQRFPILSERKFKNILIFRDELRRLAQELDCKSELLERGLNDGFSGGEKKRLEVLQLLVLQPKLAILDEIDSGLDIDALKIVVAGISRLRAETGTAIILITHHQKIVKSFSPDLVQILVAGQLVASGDMTLLDEIEKTGFGKYKIEAAQ